MTLAGTSTNAKSVGWTNDRGGQGTAIGTDTWHADNVALQTGANVITVTAVNDHGQDSKTLTVTYQPGVPMLPAPTNVTLTPATADATSAKYVGSWAAVPGAAQYHWRAGYNDGSHSTEGTTPSLTASFAMAYGASADAYYGVAAVDANSVEGEAQYMPFTVPPPPVAQPPVSTASITAVLKNYTYVFTVKAPAAVKTVQLYINDAVSGSADRATPFVFTRTFVPGTYAVKADLTPLAATRTFTDPITVVCP